MVLLLIGIFLLKPSLQEALQRDLPICFLNLGQTVEKHEEEHILTAEDHQEEKQRAMRQKNRDVDKVCLRSSNLPPLTF